MAAAFVRLAQSDCAPESTFTYVDVDIGDHGGTNDAVGVQVTLYVPSSDPEATVDVRKNGSADTWGQATALFHSSVFVVNRGVDANGVFEVYTTHLDQEFYVSGEFREPYGFKTDADDVSQSTTGSYVDVDLSSECPDAICALFSRTSTHYSYLAFERKNGSSDDYPGRLLMQLRDSICGLDVSQQCEIYISNAAVDHYVVGYYSGNAVTIHTNATDRSLASTGSYQDLDALAAGAAYGIYYEFNAQSTYSYQAYIRKNGESEDLYSCLYGAGGLGYFVECDGSRLVEGKIENISIDFYELGYGEEENAAPTAPTALLCEGATNPTAVTDLTPEFSAILNDPDPGDILTHVEIHVGTTVGGYDKWDSGWIDITDTEEGNRCPNVSYNGTSLSRNGQQYHWKIRAKDDGAEEGAWSSPAAFRMRFDLADSAGLADSVAKQLAASRVLSESLSVTSENLHALAKAFPEVLALADDLDYIADFVRGYAEQLGLSDSVANALARAVTEDLALSESVSKALSAIMQGETLALDDVFDWTWALDLVETLSLADQVVTLAELARLFSETLPAADAEVVFGLIKNLQEALPVADQVVKALSHEISEAVSLDDEALKAIARDIADQFNLSEDITLAGAKVLATDTLGLSEEMSMSLTFGRILVELLSMGDRLRLGGVWDDPNIKIILSMLKAAVKAEQRKDEAETAMRKGDMDTEVR